MYEQAFDRIDDLLRYDDSLDDALDDLGGDPEAIGAMFKGFQRHLYQHAS